VLKRLVWTTVMVALAAACEDASTVVGPLPTPTRGDQPFLSQASAGTWEAVAPLSVARDMLAATVGPDGRVYAIGGSSGTTTPVSLASVEAYSPGTNTWAAAPSLPAARHFHAAVTGAGTDRRIYVLGGVQGGSATATVLTYTVGDAGWVAVANMPMARQAHAAAVGADGRIYVSGGVNGSSILQSGGDVYDPAANRWTSIAPMARPRRQHALVRGGDGRLYAIGGITVNSAITETVEAYDPRSNTWRLMRSMPEARQGVVATLGSDGAIYVAGGRNPTGLVGTSFRYDVTTDTWSSAPSLIDPRHLAGSATVGGTIYALAGRVRVSGVDRPTASVELLVTELPNAPPTVAAGPDVTANEGSAFRATGGFTDGDSPSWTATVDYGDGSGIQPLSLTAQAFGLTHTYADNGLYTVTVKVTDDEGAMGSDVMLVNVLNVSPAVSAGDNALLIQGEPYAGTGDFFDPGADTWSATVDYGDGSGAHALSFEGRRFSLSRTYGDAGTYTVRVTVTDDDGGRGTGVAIVRVLSPSEAVEVLAARLEGMARSLDLDQGELRMLMASLRAARASIERGDLRPASKQLSAFMHKVDALIQSGRLIPESAEALVAFTQRLLDQLGTS
jgi:N-acetylneuraminic acid mutarotase